MDAISTSERASDPDIMQGTKVIDVDTHLSEPLDPNVIFETDFPHPTCLYPHPLEQVRECLTPLTPEERRTVLSANAARVYNVPPD